MLSYFQVDIYIKQKRVSKTFIIFTTLRNRTSMEIFPFKYGNNHQNNSTGIYLCGFGTAFQKKIKILSFTQVEIYAKYTANTFGHSTYFLLIATELFLL
jgi:hypothetical protein